MLASAVRWVSGPSLLPGARKCLVSHVERVSEAGICNRVCRGDLTDSQAVEALDVLVQRGSSVPKSLFYQALRGCTGNKNLVVGRRVHALTLHGGYEAYTSLAHHIIRMYVSHGRLQEAMGVFMDVVEPDCSLWGFVISVHVANGKPVQAMQLYRQMRQSSAKPDHGIFVAVLRACGISADLAFGKQVHADVLVGEGEPSVVLGSCLVNMYVKCGSLEDARRVFDKLHRKNVVTWTAMIAGYAQHGLGREALALYESMQQDCMTLGDRVTFKCLLNACASVGALQEGKKLLLQIQERGLESDLSICNCLIDMYAKCGSLGDARRVFDTMTIRDVVTWNAMIAGYANHGLGQEALSLYAGMQKDSTVAANIVTFVCLLKACAQTGALHQGRELHLLIQEWGLGAEMVVANCLVDMYAKCGSLDDARKVFDSLPVKNVITWTAIISGYAEHGLGREALHLFACMQQEGISQADVVTFVCLLKACAAVGALHEGRRLHADIRNRGLEDDVVVGSSLVDMYAKCGSIVIAREVFDRLPTKNVVTWNALLAGYVEHGFGQQALAVYACMEEDGRMSADHFTFACLVKACGSIGALDLGRQLHNQVLKRGLQADPVVAGNLVDMYLKCGSLEDARKVFDTLHSKDEVTWTVMISGYTQQGLGQEALALYADMDKEYITPGDNFTLVCLLKACASVGAVDQGRQLHSEIQKQGLEADVVVGSTLVDMYGKCGSLVDACRVFDRLPTKDVVTWNALLNSCGQHNNGLKAMQCFEEMQQQGVEPDDTTFLCLLVACSHSGLVNEGRQYFKMMAEDYRIAPSLHHYNCMVDILGRSGQLDEAESMLKAMPFEKNVVGWTSLLSSCKSHGTIECARRCFDHLIDMDPQSASSYAILASMYASAGRWTEADKIEDLRKAAGACKKPAQAWIEVNRKVRTFFVGEERLDTSSRLRSANLQLEEEGPHVPHTQLVLQPGSVSEKEDALCGHAEKLALAYGLLNTPDGTTLVVTKNLRMCIDCHSGTKIMSKIEQREIIVRDAHRVHHFVNGFCSCGDGH